MSQHVREAFIRQRRNLMGVSLVLLFAELAGLTITEINLFGNKFSIVEPRAVHQALWVGFIYWVWRYYVYFHDLGDKGIWLAHNNRMSGLVEQLAFCQLQGTPDFIARAQGRRFELGGPNGFTYSTPFHYVVNLNVAITPLAQRTNSPSDIVQFRDIAVTARVRLLILHVRAWTHVLARTH